MSKKDFTTPNEDTFSFGIRELSLAEQAREIQIRAQLESQGLSGTLASGFDPYNSTGGFDRKNAWKRTSRR